MREAAASRRTIGDTTPAGDNNGAKSKDPSKASYGRSGSHGRPPKERTSSRRGKSKSQSKRWPNSATGHERRGQKRGRCREEVGKRRERSVERSEPPCHHGSSQSGLGKGDLLPPRDQGGWDFPIDAGREWGGLWHVGSFWDYQRCAPAIPDRTSRRTAESAPMWFGLQQRGGVGQPPSLPGREKNETFRERGRLGDQSREGTTHGRERRVAKVEGKRAIERSRRSTSPRRRRPGKTQKRREGEERFQERQKEEEERKEGKRRLRGRGREDSRGWKQGQTGMPKESTTAFCWHGDGPPRKGPQQGSTASSSVLEAQVRQEFSVILNLQDQQRLRGERSRSPGVTLRRGFEGKAAGRAVSWSSDLRSCQDDEGVACAGDWHGDGLFQGHAGQCLLLPPELDEKSVRPGGARVADPHQHTGSSDPGSGGFSHGHFGSATEIGRTNDGREPLDGLAKTGDLATGSYYTHKHPRGQWSEKGGVQREQSQMGGQLSRWPCTSFHQPAEQAQRREGTRQGQQRQRPEGKERWEEERPSPRGHELEDERRASHAGAPASGEKGVSGAAAPRREEQSTPGVRAPEKDAEESSMKVERTLEEKGASDMHDTYEKGTDVALHQFSTAPVPPADTQSCSMMAVQHALVPGDMAPDENSFRTDAAADGSVDTIPNEETFVKTGPREPACSKKDEGFSALAGMKLGMTGPFLLQCLLEVLPLRSKTTGRNGKLSLFPLPTSRETFRGIGLDCNDEELAWLVCVCISLNSMWGEDLFFDGEPNKCQRMSLLYLRDQVRRFCRMNAVIEGLDWGDFLKIKTVDYRGDEVRVARSFTWENIAPALPKEIGRVPLSEICTQGCKHYVDNFELYLKPSSEQRLGRVPRVMVVDSEWVDVCKGLVSSGVCGILEEHELYHVNGVPLLNGLFGVTKDDFTADGVEIFRLIMNLIPLNNLCMSLGGDVATLPAWSTMSPFFIQPKEQLFGVK